MFLIGWLKVILHYTWTSPLNFLPFARFSWYYKYTKQVNISWKPIRWNGWRPAFWVFLFYHYDDVIMTMLASQITSLTVVYSIVYSGVDQSKHQSSASLAFVQEIHRGPVNFPHKWPVTRKMLPFDDVIMFRNVNTLRREFSWRCGFRRTNYR